jgi:hypothetical protein
MSVYEVGFPFSAIWKRVAPETIILRRRDRHVVLSDQSPTTKRMSQDEEQLNPNEKSGLPSVPVGWCCHVKSARNVGRVTDVMNECGMLMKQLIQRQRNG